jgi:hypothetical protein
MSKKFAVVTIGMAVLFVSPAWAGMTRNGSPSPQTSAQGPRYAYCYGGGNGTSYFSSVITAASASPVNIASGHDASLQQAFDAYLKSRGVVNQGSTCITSPAMADIVRGKKQREDEVAYMKLKIVETNWAGN